MDYIKAAGERLVGTRQALDLSREALAANIVGLDPEQLARYERGEAYPPLHILRRLAAALREAPDFLGAIDVQLHRFVVTPEGGQQAFAQQRIVQHVRGRMRERGVTPEALALRSGIAPDQLRGMLEGRVDVGLHLCSLSRALDCSVTEILCGCFKDTQSDYSMTGGMVPLLAWTQAAAALSAGASAEPGANGFRVCCPLVHPPGTVALKVEDDSMDGKGRPDRGYPPGTIIYVMPAREDCVADGERVVAEIGAGDVLFRAYHGKGSDRRLSALNPTVTGFAGPFQLIGKVIGAWYMKGDEF